MSMTEPGGEPRARKEFPEIMTIEEVAEYLQLHPQVVYRHVRAGTLPASRIGRTIRFKKSVLDQFLERDAWSAISDFMKFLESRKVGAAIPAPPAPEPPPSEPPPPEPRRKRPNNFSVDVD